MTVMLRTSKRTDIDKRIQSIKQVSAKNKYTAGVKKKYLTPVLRYSSILDGDKHGKVRRTYIII